MSTYALFGATGSVGSAILQVLLQSPDQPQINAYCRSKQKLAKISPGILENKRVHIFEGSLDNTELLADCLRGSHAAFHAVAQGQNQPGNSIAIDSSRQIIAALDLLRKEDSNVNLPKLVVLSSSSTEHRLMPSVPHIVASILYTALSNIYDDLKEAEKLIRSKSWITAVFIKPGALSQDTQKGHVISTTEAKSPVSFLDLAAGMLEAANEEQYDGKSIAVNATGNVAFPWQAPVDITKGLIFHFFPFMWKYLG